MNITAGADTFAAVAKCLNCGRHFRIDNIDAITVSAEQWIAGDTSDFCADCVAEYPWLAEAAEADGGDDNG